MAEIAKIHRNPVITIDTNNPDPTNAINAFLWCMAKARELNLCPPTEHTLAEHLFRKDARVVFYSSMSGVTSLIMDEAAVEGLEDDDTFDFVTAVMKRRGAKLRADKAAAAAVEVESPSEEPSP